MTPDPILAETERVRGHQSPSITESEHYAASASALGKKDEWELEEESTTGYGARVQSGW